MEVDKTYGVHLSSFCAIYFMLKIHKFKVNSRVKYGLHIPIAKITGDERVEKLL